MWVEKKNQDNLTVLSGSFVRFKPLTLSTDL